jgi:hypothetical protein
MRISYSNSGRSIPIRGPLMAIVAMSPDIRTRTLRSLYIAINPSRTLTQRAADRLYALLATKNFRSISTGLWRSCSFGRSGFRARTYTVLMALESIHRSMTPTFKPGQTVADLASCVESGMPLSGVNEPFRLATGGRMSQPGQNRNCPIKATMSALDETQAAVLHFMGYSGQPCILLGSGCLGDTESIAEIRS